MSEPAERAVPDTRICERIQFLLDGARDAAADGLTSVAETHGHQIRALRSLLDEEHDAGTADVLACAGPAVFSPVARSA